MVGRDWFLGVPLFPEQFITQTLNPHGEGKQAEQESSFLEERTILQITLNGGEEPEKQNHGLRNTSAKSC